MKSEAYNFDCLLACLLVGGIIIAGLWLPMLNVIALFVAALVIMKKDAISLLYFLIFHFFIIIS